MKTQLSIIVALMLFGVCSVQATTWTSGHHVITDANDPFGEIWMSNDATADILGGEIFKLEAFNVTAIDMLGGGLTVLKLHDNSITNLYGGDLGRLGITENGLLNLYAYDVIYYPTGGHYDSGWIEGRYLNNDLFFTFELYDVDTFSHINIVPEPTALLLLGAGFLLVRKRK